MLFPATQLFMFKGALCFILNYFKCLVYMSLFGYICMCKLFYYWCKLHLYFVLSIVNVLNVFCTFQFVFHTCISIATYTRTKIPIFISGLLLNVFSLPPSHCTLLLSCFSKHMFTCLYHFEFVISDFVYIKNVCICWVFCVGASSGPKCILYINCVLLFRIK